MDTVLRTFTAFYEQNLWEGQTRSGEGSTTEAAANIIREVPLLLGDLGVKSMLDIPCGDFNWMSQIDLGAVDYTGADIVVALVALNQARFGQSGRRFVNLDILAGPLPCVDLILCRDLFLHLPIPMIFSALETIVASGSRWLLTSHYSWRGIQINYDIAEIFVGGRRVNLEEAPFHFPPPLKTIVEGEKLEICADKSLCLWRIDDIRAVLERRAAGPGSSA
jgi:hypothetical protein